MGEPTDYERGHMDGFREGRVSGWKDGSAEGAVIGMRKAYDDLQTIEESAFKKFLHGLFLGFMVGAGITVCILIPILT